MGPWAILSIFGLALAGVMALLIYVIGVVNTMALCFVVICLMMMMVILIQKPKGGGLSGAFGSAGGGETAFGAKTGDVLTVVTISCFVAFLLLAMGLTWTIRPLDDTEGTSIQSTDTGTEPAPGSAAPGTSEPVTDLTTIPGTADMPATDTGVAAPVETPAAAPAATPAPAPAAAPAPATEAPTTTAP